MGAGANEREFHFAFSCDLTYKKSEVNSRRGLRVRKPKTLLRGIALEFCEALAAK